MGKVIKEINNILQNYKLLNKLKNHLSFFKNFRYTAYKFEIRQDILRKVMIKEKFDVEEVNRSISTLERIENAPIKDIQNVLLTEGFASVKYKYGYSSGQLSAIVNFYKLQIDKSVNKKYREIRLKHNSLEKWGVEHPMQSEIVKEKLKNVLIDKYGGIGLASDTIRKHIEEKVFKKYNVKNIFQSEKFIQYNKKIQQEKFGGLGMASPQTREKMLKTRQDHLIQDPDYYKESYKRATQTKLKHRPDDPCNHKQAIITRAKNNPKDPRAEEFGSEAHNKAMLEKYGTIFNIHIKEVRQKMKRKYLFENIYFDSSWELAIWIYCKDNNISIIKEPLKLSYLYKNKKHFYYVDFKINDKYIEVKGDYLIDNTGKWICPWDRKKDGLFEAKRQCALKNNVVIYTYEDIQPILDYIISNYGKNYLSSFKHKV